MSTAVSSQKSGGFSQIETPAVLTQKPHLSQNPNRALDKADPTNFAPLGSPAAGVDPNDPRIKSVIEGLPQEEKEEDKKEEDKKEDEAP